MNVRLYKKAELEGLRAMPKRVTNPGAHWSDKPKVRPAHRQRNFQAVGGSDGDVHFSIYQRQNLADESDFSCGVAYLPRGGLPLTLARCNGPSHKHGAITRRKRRSRRVRNPSGRPKRPIATGLSRAPWLA